MKFPAYSDDAYWTNYVIFNPDDSPAVSSKLVYLSEVNYVCGQCI